MARAGVLRSVRWHWGRWSASLRCGGCVRGRMRAEWRAAGADAGSALTLLRGDRRPAAGSRSRADTRSRGDVRSRGHVRSRADAKSCGDVRSRGTPNPAVVAWPEWWSAARNDGRRPNSYPGCMKSATPYVGRKKPTFRVVEVPRSFILTRGARNLAPGDGHLSVSMLGAYETGRRMSPRRVTPSFSYAGRMTDARMARRASRAPGFRRVTGARMAV